MSECKGKGTIYKECIIGMEHCGWTDTMSIAVGEFLKNGQEKVKFNFCPMCGRELKHK